MYYAKKDHIICINYVYDLESHMHFTLYMCLSACLIDIIKKHVVQLSALDKD